MENAVVYARYSSHNQTEQSIEGQLYAAHKYAESKGYNIIKEYCDRAKTGTNDNREAFQEMLHDCQTHSFTVIIVWKVDRFGRNREEITFNKYRAKKHGVRVEYIAENITEGPEGVILEAVLEGMAEYYSLQLSQNVKRGIYETAKKSHVIGGRVPFGYKKGKNNEYEIDEDTASVVRLIYDLCENGYTMANIIDYLNSHGYRNRNGTLFTKNSIPSILSNERYTGTYIFKNVIKKENAIPAIISKEQFEKVQKIKAMNRRMPSHCWNYSDYLLTDKLVCGICGQPMIGRSGYSKHKVKYNYYTCLGRVKKACHKKSIRQDRLEYEVLNEVMNVLKNPDTFDELVRLVYEYAQSNDKTESEYRNITQKLAEIDAAIENLLRSIEQGIDYNLVKNRLEKLNDEKTLYEKLKAMKELERGTVITEEQISSFLTEFVSMNYEDKPCQKALIDELINKVYLYDDRITIVLNTTDSVRQYALNQGISLSRRTLYIDDGFIVLNHNLEF